MEKHQIIDRLMEVHRQIDDFIKNPISMRSALIDIDNLIYEVIEDIKVDRL